MNRWFKSTGQNNQFKRHWHPPSAIANSAAEGRIAPIAAHAIKKTFRLGVSGGRNIVTGQLFL
jgi:hypothetical protein